MLKKRKRKKILYSTILALSIFIMTICMGYSILSSSINVNGIAIGTYNSPILNINMIATYGKYTTGSFPNTIVFDSENLIYGNLSVTFKVKKSTAANKSGTFTITFSNSNSYNMTNGSINTTKIYGTSVANFYSSLSATSIAPGSIGTASVGITFKTKNMTNIQINTTISYAVNGVTKSFTYIIYIIN